MPSSARQPPRKHKTCYLHPGVPCSAGSAWACRDPTDRVAKRGGNPVLGQQRHAWQRCSPRPFVRADLGALAVSARGRMMWCPIRHDTFPAAGCRCSALRLMGPSSHMGLRPSFNTAGNFPAASPSHVVTPQVASRSPSFPDLQTPAVRRATAVVQGSCPGRRTAAAPTHLPRSLHRLSYPNSPASALPSDHVARARLISCLVILPV